MQYMNSFVLLSGISLLKQMLLLKIYSLPVQLIVVQTVLGVLNYFCIVTENCLEVCIFTMLKLVLYLRTD